MLFRSYRDLRIGLLCQHVAILTQSTSDLVEHPGIVVFSRIQPWEKVHLVGARVAGGGADVGTDLRLDCPPRRNRPADADGYFSSPIAWSGCVLVGDWV